MTVKQKTAVQILASNPGKPVGKAMVEAGYSPATAINPTVLTESKGYQELIIKILNPEKVLKTIDKGMEANKIITSNTEPDYEYPDWQSRSKFTDQAADMLRMKPDKNEIKNTNVLVIPILGGTSIEGVGIVQSNNSNKQDNTAQETD